MIKSESDLDLLINQYFKESHTSIVKVIKSETNAFIERHRNHFQRNHHEIAKDLTATNKSISGYSKIIIDLLAQFPNYCRIAQVLKIIDQSMERIFDFLRIELTKRKNYEMELIEVLQGKGQKQMCNQCQNLILFKSIEEIKLELGIGQFKDPFNLYGYGESEFLIFKRSDEEYKKKFMEILQNRKNVEEKLRFMKLQNDKREYNLEMCQSDLQSIQKIFKQHFKNQLVCKSIPFNAQKGFENNLRTLVVKIHQVMMKYRRQNTLVDQEVQATENITDSLNKISKINEKLERQAKLLDNKIDQKDKQILELRTAKSQLKLDIERFELQKKENLKVIDSLKKTVGILNKKIIDNERNKQQNEEPRRTNASTSVKIIENANNKSKKSKKAIKEEARSKKSMKNLVSMKKIKEEEEKHIGLNQNEDEYEKISESRIKFQMNKKKSQHFSRKRGGSRIQNSSEVSKSKVQKKQSIHHNIEIVEETKVVGQRKDCENLLNDEIQQNMKEGKVGKQYNLNKQDLDLDSYERQFSIQQRSTLKQLTSLEARKKKIIKRSVKKIYEQNFGELLNEKHHYEQIKSFRKFSKRESGPRQSIKINSEGNKLKKDDLLKQRKQSKKIKNSNDSSLDGNIRIEKDSLTADNVIKTTEQKKGKAKEQRLVKLESISHSKAKQNMPVLKSHDKLNQKSNRLENILKQNTKLKNQTFHVNNQKKRSLLEKKPSLLCENKKKNEDIIFSLYQNLQSEDLDLDFQRFNESISAAINNCLKKKNQISITCVQEKKKMEQNENFIEKPHIQTFFNKSPKFDESKNLLKNENKSFSRLKKMRNTTNEHILAWKKLDQSQSNSQLTNSNEMYVSMDQEELFKSVFISQENAFNFQNERKSKKSKVCKRQKIQGLQLNILNSFLLTFAKLHSSNPNLYAKTKQFLLFPFSQKQHGLLTPPVTKSQGIGISFEQGLIQVIVMHRNCQKEVNEPYCCHLLYLHQWLMSMI